MVNKDEYIIYLLALQYSDTVGWATGRTSGL